MTERPEVGEREAVERDADERATGNPATERRGVVAFDNTGTLSDPVVEWAAVSDDAMAETPVPEMPTDRPTALASVALDDYDVFDADESLGAVVAAADLPVTLALSNVETTAEAVREAVVADDEVPARAVIQQVEALIERASAEFSRDDPPVGVQLAVDLDTGRIHRVFAYTTVPRAVAAEVVGRTRELGYEPHVVSGDATHILRRVAEEVGVPAANVHAYQSATDKADTLSALRTDGASAVMVGDYVNDRFALELADLGILVREGDPDDGPADRADGPADPDDGLADRADATVAGIEDVPAILNPDGDR